MKTLPPAEISSLWERLCQDPRFQDLGYKIEIQRNGHLHMSPGNIRHGLLQFEVGYLLRMLLTGGRPSTETAIETADGILVPDVCWGSDEWLDRESERYSAETAPEICVEIMSPSNSLEEMAAKRDAYFERGCEEFFLVDPKGGVTFFSHEGAMEESRRAPTFPTTIEL